MIDFEMNYDKKNALSHTTIHFYYPCFMIILHNKLIKFIQTGKCIY